MPSRGLVVVAHACHSRHSGCHCPEPRWQRPCIKGCTCGENAGPPPPPYISSGCSDPAAPQATLARNDYPRHPYVGSRPTWSGYCVITDCACECHQAQVSAIPEVNLEVLSGTDS